MPNNPFNNPMIDMAGRIVELERRIEQLEAQSFTARVGWSTWTPTSPGASWVNIDSLTITDGNYVQALNAVFCFGRVGIDWTSAGALVNTEFDFTLPIAASFNINYDCIGFFFRYNIDFTQSFGPGVITAKVANDRANFQFLVDGITASPILFYYQFVYFIE